MAVLAGCGTTEGLEAPEAPGGLEARRGSYQGQLSRLLGRQGGRRTFRLPDSHRLWRIPQDPANPLTDAKVALGELLFHETALGSVPVQAASAETYACASCHQAAGGFGAALPQGIGEGGSGFGAAGESRVVDTAYDSSAPEWTPDVQPIRSPTALNGAYQELMLWNGQFGGVGDNLGTEAGWNGPIANNFEGLQGLETQALAGLTVHRMSVAGSRVETDPTYVAAFADAFPGEASPVTQRNAALAIAAYERTVLANQAPFQRWIRGDTRAMTDAQMRGAILFFGDANCSTCHTGPALNDMDFHALGMDDLDAAVAPGADLRPFGGTVPDAVRRGRGGFTGDPSEDYAFKTPQLYNLADAGSYGHGATFDSVRDVIAYKNAAVPQAAHVPADALDPAFVPLGLSDAEIDDLTAFVVEALYDPDLHRYEPDTLPSGNCFPVNDAAGADDLCE
jgi:cytochrome c peroxidase